MREFFLRVRPTLFVFLLASLAVAAVILFDRQRRQPEPLQVDFAAPPRRDIRVEVTGEVRSPGVYTLHAGDRVADALATAGGILPDADLSRVNQAALLVDGQQVRVTATGATPAAGKIDINTASAAVLQALPGVGETRAEAIVASRDQQGPFMRVDELTERGLLPSSVLDGIRDLIVVGP